MFTGKGMNACEKLNQKREKYGGRRKGEQKQVVLSIGIKRSAVSLPCHKL